MKNILNKLELTAEESGTFAGSWLKDETKEWITSSSPINGEELARVSVTTPDNYERVIESAQDTFHRWRMLPAPKRGEVIRQIGEEFRRLKEPLGQLVTLEMGKILPEGLGEIQEVVDIAEFSVGLSRQLCGKTMHSERELHRMYEQWHPLGPIGVITAFNFPAAVWGWNACIAAVCGDTTVWKASEITPLTAIAITKLCHRVTEAHGFAGLFNLVTGSGAEIGKLLAEDRRLPLISATGSCRMGRSVAETVGKRLGRTLLELGGNNAVIVLADANLDLAVRGILFGAVGTAGQRCTSTRRIFVDESIMEVLVQRLQDAYQQINIGNPLDEGVLMGPLVHQAAVDSYLAAIAQINAEGGKIICGGELIEGLSSKLYVAPTIVQANKRMSIIQEETFAPILYVLPIKNLDEAIELQNSVPQGLSSAIFTESMRSAEEFLSHRGSDCGIANVNIGTSGAEIGGAFGGEKDTGGGREAGSDSWKAYMRRQTNTINWGDDLPLAQGIEFGG